MSYTLALRGAPDLPWYASVRQTMVRLGIRGKDILLPSETPTEITADVIVYHAGLLSDPSRALRDINWLAHEHLNTCVIAVTPGWTLTASVRTAFLEELEGSLPWVTVVSSVEEGIDWAAQRLNLNTGLLLANDQPEVRSAAAEFYINLIRKVVLKNLGLRRLVVSKPKPGRRTPFLSSQDYDTVAQYWESCGWRFEFNGRDIGSGWWGDFILTKIEHNI
jgi:hypothetical protein